MNKAAGFVFALIFCSSIHAQIAGYNPVKDESAFRQKFNEASKLTNSIKADFVQEKDLSMLSEKIISKGSFYFKKESKVRLEYKTPFKYLMVINGSKVLVKDDAKENKFDTHSNKIFKQVNELIVNSVQGTILNSADFKVKVSENATQYYLQMTPGAKGLKEFFSGINIFIDKKDYSVSRIEMVEVSGDSTTITFNNKELNGKLDEGLFVAN
jgi:outer membrane lipoprotein-sorting protein